MIQSQLKTALTAAGCTLVLYESAKLANVIADQANATQVVGLVLEADEFTLEAAGNGVQEHYPNLKVEILKQSAPEDSAENNAATLENLLTIAKAFIHQLKTGGHFYRVPSVPITKVQENHYDANVIGWQLALDLKFIANGTNC